MKLSETESYDIPQGHDDLTITNLDPNLAGAYIVKGDTVDIDTEIPSGETHTIQTQKNAAIVTNTGYPMLEVILPVDSEES